MVKRKEERIAIVEIGSDMNDNSMDRIINMPVCQ